MKILVMFLLGALVTSGWWVIGIWGFPVTHDSPPLLIASAVFTLVLSIFGVLIIGIKIFDEWQ